MNIIKHSFVKPTTLGFTKLRYSTQVHSTRLLYWLNVGSLQGVTSYDSWMASSENAKKIRLRAYHCQHIWGATTIMRFALSGLSSTWHQPSGRMGAGTEGNKVRYGITYTPWNNGCVLIWPSSSWLYTLFLALDANFRMSRKGVSTKARDPCLTQGRGYFVEDEAFLAHLEAHKNHRQEVSDSFYLNG